MSGIKDLHSLLFLLDGSKSKQSVMKKILGNKRQLPREKAHILRELERENWPLRPNREAPKFANEPPGC